MRLKWLLIAATLLAACEDSTAGRGDDTAPPPMRDAGPRVPPEPDAAPEPEPDAAPEPEPDAAPEPEPERYRLVIDGDARPTVHHGETIELAVRYLDADDRPVDGTVEAHLLDDAGNDRTAEGIGGTVLTASEADTDAEGRAVFELTAGDAPGEITVEARAEKADPVRWRVTVTHAPTGTVAVRVTYDAQAGRYPPAVLTEARVGLFVNVDCAALAAGNPPAPIDIPPAIAPFDGDDTTESGALPHGVRVAAMATAVNAAGSALARGCADGVQVAGGERREVSITVTDLPLEMKGVYEVEHHLDLSEMLAQANGGDLADLVDVLDIIGAIGGGLGEGPFPRGDGIVRLACERGGLDPAQCDPLRLIAAPIIEQFIDEIVPPDVLEGLDVLGDLYRILADLTVLGEIEVTASYPDAEGLLPNNQSRWTAFRYVWRQGCPFDAPEQCTRVFGLEEAGVGARTLVGVFDARMLEEDLLAIGVHRHQVRIGALAVALAERWLLPAILGEPGPVTLEDYLLRLIPCADINAALPPGDPASGVCERTIVRPLAGQIRVQIEQAAGGADTFTFAGTVRVVDAVPDLSVDHLVDGVWNGAFGEAAEADLLPGVGTFEGCRRGFCEEPAP